MKKVALTLIATITVLSLTSCSSKSEKKTTKTSDTKQEQKNKEAVKKAEKEKQDLISQKVKEADEKMKTLEASLTDDNYNAAKDSLAAVPDGNPDLQKRLETASANLTAAKKQAEAQAQQQAEQQTNQPSANVVSNSGYEGHQDLTDFMNSHDGMSPVAYKIKVEGMSAEDALRSTPNNMKTSGEIQTGYMKYGIQ